MQIGTEVKIILKQEIIELVRLGATESIRDVGFSSSWISIRTRGLITIKGVYKLTEYTGQLFISIIVLTGFWLWASSRSRSIKCQISSEINSKSILPIRIVVCRDDT